MQSYTIIVVLWKYRLSLSRLKKPANVRVFVVGPPRMLADETDVDVYYQVDPPMRDHENCQLLDKVRELCSIYAATHRRLVVLERALQRPIAQIRKEMSIEGHLPEQLEVLLSVRDALSNPRRNGLATLRQCSLSGTPQPEQWMEAVRTQVGGFPAVVRPLRPHCAHSVGVVRNETEFKQWFRRNSNVHRCEEYIVEQYVDDGHEFTAMCTAKNGLLGCISTVATHRSVLESIQGQQPYALELFSVDQTRDLLPGLESFAMQVLKSQFARNYCGVIFIKGFYKDHNDIFFLGFSLEPECETFRALLALPKTTPWEAVSIESLFETDDDHKGSSSVPSAYHAVINFPTAEGVLLHQTSIPKRRSSTMRVAWRVAEGHEMRDSDSMDENVAQVFLTNNHRGRLLEECQEILSGTDITIDKNVLSDRHTVCRRNGARLNPKELVRSCTTTD